jgi:O-antigen ligase
LGATSTSTGAGGSTFADRVETTGFASLIGFVVAVQFSIFVAELFLVLAAVCWLAVVALKGERLAAPSMFWPLAAYGALTLVAALFSLDTAGSLRDCKQLLWFLIVPLVYRLARGPRASNLVWVIITSGAASALVGIVEYGIFEFDLLGSRLHGTLGHWMTYAGLLMLAAVVALARVLFRRRDRTWPLLVLPALFVALGLTLTRSAWVGLSAAMALLFLLKDFRLVAVLPIVAASFFVLAPHSLTSRFYSIFDLHDPTNRDRISMVHAGVKIIRDYPLTGVGPNDVERLYPKYRDADAVKPNQPHLHNVLLQIAAERGLPALGVWLWFVVTLIVQLARRFRAAPYRVLPAAGLGVVVAMLAAGMFEHNFGDSEFLMLFLTIVTLPYAVECEQDRDVAVSRPAES